MHIYAPGGEDIKLSTIYMLALLYMTHNYNITVSVIVLRRMNKTNNFLTVDKLFTKKFH